MKRSTAKEIKHRAFRQYEADNFIGRYLKREEEKVPKRISWSEYERLLNKIVGGE